MDMEKIPGKRSAYAFISIAFALVLSAATALAAGGDRVTAEELGAMLADGDGKVVLIDVRTPAEHREAHIPGSVLMPLYTLEGVDDIPEGNRVILYCRSGKRSLRAMDILSAKGFTGLADLEGGINAWIRSGGDVVRGGR